MRKLRTSHAPDHLPFPRKPRRYPAEQICVVQPRLHHIWLLLANEPPELPQGSGKIKYRIHLQRLHFNSQVSQQLPHFAGFL
ncbi:MAG TPA: hypothetical protein VEI52_17265 [Terriglobales bacterium]|nr:hypothetical protein [Terriglobales bacterium]